MGQVLGFFAKKKNELISETPFYAEEESFYSLANIFSTPKSYISNVLKHSKLEEIEKNQLYLKEEEVQALLFNNVQDFADDQIDYKKSINEALPVNFRAIGINYLE